MPAVRAPGAHAGAPLLTHSGERTLRPTLRTPRQPAAARCASRSKPPGRKSRAARAGWRTGCPEASGACPTKARRATPVQKRRQDAGGTCTGRTRRCDPTKRRPFDCARGRRDPAKASGAGVSYKSRIHPEAGASGLGESGGRGPFGSGPLKPIRGRQCKAARRGRAQRRAKRRQDAGGTRAQQAAPYGLTDSRQRPTMRETKTKNVKG
jgi:hypothetical protein